MHPSRRGVISSCSGGDGQVWAGDLQQLPLRLLVAAVWERGRVEKGFLHPPRIEVAELMDIPSGKWS